MYPFSYMHPSHAVKPPHCFALRDLIQDALTTDRVHCPKHSGFVDLEILVSLWKRIISTAFDHPQAPRSCLFSWLDRATLTDGNIFTCYSHYCRM